MRTLTTNFTEPLAQADPELYSIVQCELERQNTHLELIASENMASRAVMEAQGSVLTNKYAEGLPGKRYYGGCEFVDRAEEIAIKRVKQIFGAEHANVQPHSGAQANMAVFLSCLQPGDTYLGMALDQGGHLTHGSPVNISGKWFNPIHYGVTQDGWLDYEDLEAKALEHKPKLIIAGASAYPRIIDFTKFRAVADRCGAKLLVDMAHIAGLVAAGLHPSPVPFADYVTSTTHKTLRGPRGGIILCKSEYAKAIDSAVFPGTQGGPLMHVIAAKAVAFREALDPSFKDYQRRILSNCKALAEGLLKQRQTLVSGGSDNHLVLINLIERGITGKDAETLLSEVCITANKNAVPGDPQKPWITSGIRVGTPACTTRGLTETEFSRLGEIIGSLLNNPSDEELRQSCKEQVSEICKAFPVI